jgi:hypothetical protein
MTEQALLVPITKTKGLRAPASQVPWRNRIVGSGEAAPDELLANPNNWRLHGKGQQAALEGALNDVGSVAQILINKRTGHLVDGHLRVELALARREPSVPVTYVDLTEDEERTILATLDPIGAMASADKAKLEKLLRELTPVDAAYGDERGDELPPGLRTDAGRLEAIREAKAALEAEAKVRTGNPDAVPEPKAQRNFTDPESRMMRSRPDGWVQGYNVGAVVDDTAQVIVATVVTADPVDTRSLPGLVEQVTRNTGRSPRRLLADAGYCSDDNLAHLAGAGIDAYVAVARDHHGREAPAAPRGRIPARLSARERMSRKLRTKEGRRHYARRKAIVEPVFGQIKEARGFRRFSLRGLEAVRAEWMLVVAVHNLGKLFGSGRAGRVLPGWTPTRRRTTGWATG